MSQNRLTVSYTLTEYDEADYEAMIRIGKANRPDELDSVEDIRDWDENNRRAGRRSSRWHALVDGEVVGFGSLGESPWLNGEIRYTDIEVHPDHQHRGIGRALLERVETLAAERGVESLITNTEEHRDRTIRFLEAAGYVEIDRDWRSTLDLDEFDRNAWSDAIARVTASGVQIVSAAELRETFPDWIDRLYELYVEVEGDMPVWKRATVSLVMFLIHFGTNGFVPKAGTLRMELPWILGTALFAYFVLGVKPITALALVAADSVMTLSLR